MLGEQPRSPDWQASQVYLVDNTASLLTDEAEAGTST